MEDPIITTALTTLISAAVPSLITAIFGIHNNRQAKMHSAKQSILQMIMEDQFNFKAFGKLPANYQAIIEEYEIYHANGGNHNVTKKYEEYLDWYDKLEVSEKK